MSESKLSRWLVGLCAVLAVAMVGAALGQTVRLSRERTRVASSERQLVQVQQETAALQGEYQTLSKRYKDLSAAALRTATVASLVHIKVPSTAPKVAYITIDDGPSDNTPKLLRALDQAGVKATFFVIGRNCSEYPNGLSEILQAGHAVGVHSWTHQYSYMYANMANFRQDFDELYKYLTARMGHAPDICRFPGGTNNHKAISQNKGDMSMTKAVEYALSKGVRPVDWNAYVGDADLPYPTAAQEVARAIREVGAKRQPIILMHDTPGAKLSTIEALPQIVAQLRREGYSFGVLSATDRYAALFRPQN